MPKDVKKVSITMVCDMKYLSEKMRKSGHFETECKFVAIALKFRNFLEFMQSSVF